MFKKMKAKAYRDGFRAGSVQGWESRDALIVSNQDKIMERLRAYEERFVVGRGDVEMVKLWHEFAMVYEGRFMKRDWDNKVRRERSK